MAHSFVALVALLSIIVYFVTIARTGQARGKHGIKAPAVTGHPDFERAYRVQMNTLENLVPFLALLFLSSRFGSDWIAAALGLVWVVGRVIYMQAYLKSPDKRGLGFAIAGIALILLLIGALIGIITSLF